MYRHIYAQSIISFYKIEHNFPNDAYIGIAVQFENNFVPAAKRQIVIDGAEQDHCITLF